MIGQASRNIRVRAARRGRLLRVSALSRRIMAGYYKSQAIFSLSSCSPATTRSARTPAKVSKSFRAQRFNDRARKSHSEIGLRAKIYGVKIIFALCHQCHHEYSRRFQSHF